MKFNLQAMKIFLNFVHNYEERLKKREERAIWTRRVNSYEKDVDCSRYAK